MKYSCFLTCFREITKDLGREIAEQEFIDRFPKTCRRGTEEEGCFSETQEYPLEKIVFDFGFSCKRLLHIGESVGNNILICFDNFRRQNKSHSVRFVSIHEDQKGITVYNFSRQEEMKLTVKDLKDFGPTLFIQINRL